MNSQNNIHLFMATHSPYIFNGLNVLLRKNILTENDLGVYHIIDGRLYDLLSQDIETKKWFVDTTGLSEPMDRIYQEYVMYNEN